MMVYSAPETTVPRLHRRPLSRRRLVALVASQLSMMAAGVGLAPAAHAATPVSFPNVPIASWRANGPGYASLVIGETVYVGGSFTTTTSPNGATSVNRGNLAAYDARTGALVGTFNAHTNGAVRALAYDGTNLYVGGSFTSINGVSRGRLAAVDPVSGAVRAGWRADANSNVYGLSVAVDARRLFAVGSFSTFGGASRSRIAAANLSDGSVTSFAPSSASTVVTVAATRDGGAVYVGGNLTTVNGTSVRGLTGLDASGAIVPRSWRSMSSIVLDLELSSDGSRLAVGMGGAGNQGAWYDTSSGVRLIYQVCDGDGQAVHVIQGSLFSGFHEACAGDTTIRLTNNNVDTGVRDMSFRPSFDQFWGVRDIAGNAGALVIAGEFTNVSGVLVTGFAIFRA